MTPTSLEPVAWLHEITYETGEKSQRVTLTQNHIWGEAGKDYSAEFPIASTPLYRHPPKDEADWPDMLRTKIEAVLPPFDVEKVARELIDGWISWRDSVTGKEQPQVFGLSKLAERFASALRAATEPLERRITELNTECQASMTEIANLRSEIEELQKSFEHNVTAAGRYADKLEAAEATIATGLFLTADEVASIRSALIDRVENLQSQLAEDYYDNMDADCRRCRSLFPVMSRLEEVLSPPAASAERKSEGKG